MADSFNPFASLGDLFGKPASLRAQEEANAGALQRAGIAAGTAANALAEQRRQFDSQGQIIMAAARRWQQLVDEQGPTITIGEPGTTALDVQQNPMGGGGLGGTDAALRKFVQTPEFMMLPRAGIKYDDMIKALQQNPAALEQFTLGPGQQRFEAAPGGTGRLVAENTNAAPKPYESSIDKARTDILKGVAEGLQPAQTQLMELNQLVDPLLRTGATFPGGTWRGMAARLGINVGPRTSDIQVVQSILDGLTPLQRRGLPGAASDRDMATFRGRLPDLIRTAEGNQEIAAFLLAQARAGVQAGQIASEAFTRGADPGQTLERANTVRFSDVLEQTRREIEDRHAEAVQGSLGIDVRGIPTMNAQELRNFTIGIRSRFPNGVPAGIQRRIQQRALEIERDMNR